MNAEEIKVVNDILSGILGNDNNVRKECEQKLQQLKQEADKYVAYLMEILKQSQDLNTRALATVLLRRNLSVVNDEKDNLWFQISAGAKDFTKGALRELLQTQLPKTLMHKVADLVAEVGGSINDIDGQIWQELLQDLF